ncbi:MAG: MFS transporter [Clostridia bacterium]|nr:MFS transporter [Clostridia bacterium]
MKSYEQGRLTTSYAAIQFFFWFVYGTALAFASPYLLACGLSNTAIGGISAAACALSVALQPLIASYADRGTSPSVKTFLLIAAGGMVFFGLLLSGVYGKGALLNGLLLGAAILLIQLALPFTNALATETINQGKPLKFSFARAFGSIGYAVMSVTVGRLVAWKGPGAEPWILIVTSVCFLIAILLFPFEKEKKQAEEKEHAKSSMLAFFRRYPAFAATLIGCVLIYISHVVINNFAFQIVEIKGGTSEHMGTALALAGILEVLTMFFFSLLLRWKDSGFWFGISGVFFTLKVLGTYLAPSIPVLYLVQLFQPLGWGLMTVASVYYVNGIMQEQDRIKGQAYMTMSLSVATILGSLTGGWMIDTIGVNGMLIVAMLCGALGTLIVLFILLPRQNKTRSTSGQYPQSPA